MYKVVAYDVKNRIVTVEDISRFRFTKTIDKMTVDEVLEASKLGFKVLGVLPNNTIVVFDDYLKIAKMVGNYVIYNETSRAEAAKELSGTVDIDLGNKVVILHDNINHLFSNITCDTLSINRADVSGVRSMRLLFNSAKINQLYLTGWNTSNVADMAFMFYRFAGNVQGLENLDMSNVENMESMFASSVMDINIGSWNTGKCLNFSKMFEHYGNCYCNVTGIENMDVSSADSLYEMFKNAHIENIDISKWSIKEGCIIQQMFRNMDTKYINMSDKKLIGIILTDVFGGLSVNNMEINNWSLTDCNMFRMFIDCKFKTLSMRNMTIKGRMYGINSAFSGCKIGVLDIRGLKGGTSLFDKASGSVHTLIMTKDYELRNRILSNSSLKVKEINYD